MDRGARQVTVHGVAKSRTRLSHFTSAMITVNGTCQTAHCCYAMEHSALTENLLLPAQNYKSQRPMFFTIVSPTAEVNSFFKTRTSMLLHGLRYKHNLFYCALQILWFFFFRFFFTNSRFVASWHQASLSVPLSLQHYF